MILGRNEGLQLGDVDGRVDGLLEGAMLGNSVGFCDGDELGLIVGS